MTVVRYSILRLLIFFGVLLALWLVGIRDNPVLLLAFSAIISAVLSYVLLRGMQYRPVGVDLVPQEHHRPRREVLTLLISARPDAAPTRLPTSVHFTAWPIVQGHRGKAIPAGDFPLTVIEAAARPAEK